MEGYGCVIFGARCAGLRIYEGGCFVVVCVGF